MVSALTRDRAHFVRNWTDLEQRVNVTSACVLGVVDLADASTRERIRHLRKRFVWTPLILVTSLNAANARWLKDIDVDDIVWCDCVNQALGPAVEAAAARPVVTSIAGWIEAHPLLDRRLKTALVAACLAEPPLRWIKRDVARAAHTSVSTLESLWRSVYGSNEAHSLRRFLLWMRLLWAIERAQQGAKVAAIAHDLGVDTRTVSRTATLLTGKSFGALKSEDPAALLRIVLNAYDPDRAVLVKL
jgi:hypothetical protein